MTKPNFSLERKLWKQDVKYVIGIDEVGRGAFAGPIVAGAIVFSVIKKITKKLKFLRKINDSKLLKAKDRRKLAKSIKKHALFWSVDEVGINDINKYGIGKANRMVIKSVAKKILLQIKNQSFFLLCDGLPIPGLKKHMAIVDGDSRSLSIASASIIAKVHRDNLMRDLSKTYKNYKLSRNKGYGTLAHQKALKLYGLTNIHRTSFNLKKFLNQPL